MRTKEIYERISALDGGSVIFASDFLDMCTERQAGRVLTDLDEKGIIKRLARGIYCKPTATRFGPLYPSMSEVVEAVARRDHAQTLPSGYTAANMLGFSTQVPMTYSFITSGSSRQLTLDGKTINLQQIAESPSVLQDSNLSIYSYKRSNYCFHPNGHHTYIIFEGFLVLILVNGRF